MKTILACLGVLLSGCVGASTWPTTSNDPVTIQPHPTLAESRSRQKIDGSAPYRLVAFGGQQALAAIIDTGNIVNSGRHADQFAMLRDVLEPLRRWPYLVAVGNHELDQDLDYQGRRNFVAFIGEVPGPPFNEQSGTGSTQRDCV